MKFGNIFFIVLFLFYKEICEFSKLYSKILIIKNKIATIFLINLSIK